ncbi:MAG: uroporphyrinogen-III synthase [Marinilabiliaceae bacterium]|nr:uroporphyrinogen-III synthase [Marinilabiliaceae bacterium]
MKIKKILVSQPKPDTPKSPYFDIATQNCIKVDFRPFTQTEGITAREFKKQKIDILAYTAVIFTSRTAIDNYFRICEELKINVPERMKYFCLTEASAFYLQKYVVYRKRKVLFSKGRLTDLIDVVKKHKDEKYLVPISDINKHEIVDLLSKAKIKFGKASFYRTELCDLKDLKISTYDILVFFSSASIKSLFHNFADFKQKNTIIAAFGDSTAKAVTDAGLRLDIQAPTTETPSMTAALELFINKHNEVSLAKT